MDQVAVSYLGGGGRESLSYAVATKKLFWLDFCPRTQREYKQMVR